MGGLGELEGSLEVSQETVKVSCGQFPWPLQVLRKFSTGFRRLPQVVMYAKMICDELRRVVRSVVNWGFQGYC